MNKVFIKIKIKLVQLQLVLSHLLAKIANIFDLLAIKAQPKSFTVKVNDNVMQLLGPADAFGEKKYFEVYADGVDWQHEFSNVKTTIYSSVDEVKENSKCWNSCGIIKLNLKLVSYKWCIKQDLFNPKYLIEYKPKKGKNNARRRTKGNDYKTK